MSTRLDILQPWCISDLICEYQTCCGCSSFPVSSVGKHGDRETTAAIYNSCVADVAGATTTATFFSPLTRVPPCHARHVSHHLSHFCVLMFSVSEYISHLKPSSWVLHFVPPRAHGSSQPSREGKTSVPALNVKPFKRSVIRERLLTLMRCISIKHHGNGSGAT